MTGTARDGWLQVLHAEWTKLRTVRRWTVTLLAAVGLSVLLSLVVAAASTTDINRSPAFVAGPDGTPVDDEFQFAHQTLTGDMTITAHVRSQRDSHEWAAAGLMMKDGTTSGSRFAAVAVTPGHGVRMQANFTTDIAAPDSSVRWLRLARVGDTVSGYGSTDGTTWRRIGSRSGLRLPATVEVGLFVSSPPRLVLQRQAGSTSVGVVPTDGEAVFDSVRIDGAAVDLRGSQVRRPDLSTDDPPPGTEPGADDGKGSIRGGVTQVDGVYTVFGAGKIGPNPPDDDIVQVSLFGIFAAVIALLSIGVLFMTSEFKRGMLRTTFAASPGRGRVLAAKAVVLGVTTFLTALVAGAVAFVTAQPVLRSRGWAPPAFPPASLTDGPVLRAVVMSAVFVAAIALLGLGTAAIMRHSAAAITTVVAIVVLPFLLGSMLPAPTARWVMQLTPAGGFASMRAKPPTDTLADPSAMIEPWSGLGVACLYAAVALAGGWWLLRRRDV